MNAADQSPPAPAPFRWQAKVTASVAVVIIAAQCYFSWVLANSKLEVLALNVAVLLLGVSLGWVFGIFISPIGSEKDEFSQYGKAVSVFFSGYLLAKIDPVFTKQPPQKACSRILPPFDFSPS